MATLPTSDVTISPTPSPHIPPCKSSWGTYSDIIQSVVPLCSYQLPLHLANYFPTLFSIFRTSLINASSLPSYFSPFLFHNVLPSNLLTCCLELPCLLLHLQWLLSTALCFTFLFPFFFSSFCSVLPPPSLRNSAEDQRGKNQQYKLEIWWDLSVTNKNAFALATVANSV